MTITRVAGIALIVAGAFLLWQGWEARQSFSSRLSETLQGTPSDQSLWMLGAGAVAAIAGVLLTLRR